MLARAVPEMPCNVLLENRGMAGTVLCYPSLPTPPEEPPALDQAVRWIAQLAALWVAAAATNQARDVVAWLSAFNGPHENVSYYAVSPTLNEKMCPSVSPAREGQGDGSSLAITSLPHLYPLPRGGEP